MSKLTGKMRYRSAEINKEEVMVLQVEYRYFRSGCYYNDWRDAKLSDINAEAINRDITTT